MSDDEKIHVDATRPATLHNGTGLGRGARLGSPGAA
jgi:hypothetical protein